MIRLPGIRTGIEVFTDDIAFGIVAQNAAPPNAILGALSTHGIDWDPSVDSLLNPHLRLADLVDDNDGLIGQIVFSDPGASAVPGELVTNLAELDIKMSEDQILAEFFAGVKPGHERWSWFGSAWPQSFRLRSADYGSAVVSTGESATYPIQTFAGVSPVTGAGKLYAIDNDVKPAGFLFVDESNGVQSWFARQGYLVNQLLPPDRHGYWTFRISKGPPPSQTHLGLTGNPLSPV
ncbi:MAG: hypothetical protein AAF211_31495 [Myxococcota bacterium]